MYDTLISLISGKSSIKNNKKITDFIDVKLCQRKIVIFNKSL